MHDESFWLVQRVWVGCCVCNQSKSVKSARERLSADIYGLCQYSTESNRAIDGLLFACLRHRLSSKWKMCSFSIVRLPLYNTYLNFFYNNLYNRTFYWTFTYNYSIHNFKHCFSIKSTIEYIDFSIKFFYVFFCIYLDFFLLSNSSVI